MYICTVTGCAEERQRKSKALTLNIWDVVVVKIFSFIRVRSGFICEVQNVGNAALQSNNDAPKYSLAKRLDFSAVNCA